MNNENSFKRNHLACLKTTGDPDEISDILSNLSYKEIPLILEYIPDLLQHRSWMVKTDTLEIIASAKLKQFEKQVLNVLNKEKYYMTRKIALGTYHELAGQKAIPILKKYSKDRYRIVRLCALCRLYVATRNNEILGQIRSIISNKDCGVWDLYYVYNFMVESFNVREKPDILLLIKEILNRVDPSTGLSRDMKSYMRKISK